MSQSKTLKAESRARTGSGVLKQMRREGWVPSVVYGGADENQNVKVPAKAFGDMIRLSASKNFLVDLELDSGKKQLAFVQAIQRNAITGILLHADFLAVKDDTEITAHIPVALEGEPAGVKLGGLLEQLLYTIEISCLPKNLPEVIPASVDDLKVGDQLHIGEMIFPEGVKPHLASDVVVALVAKTRAAESAGVEDEAATEGASDDSATEASGAE